MAEESQKSVKASLAPNQQVCGYCYHWVSFESMYSECSKEIWDIYHPIFKAHNLWGMCCAEKIPQDRARAKCLGERYPDPFEVVPDELHIVTGIYHGCDEWELEWDLRNIYEPEARPTQS